MGKYGDVVDTEGKRLFPANKKVHTCSTCGKQDIWGEGWQWYGSWKDIDDGKEITKTCSTECRFGIEKKQNN